MTGAVPNDLQAHLDGGTTTLCNCWKLARADGRVMGFTDHDEDLHFDGVAFLAASGLGVSEVASSTGFSTDNSEVAGALISDSLIDADIDAGLYDGAVLERWLVNWSSTAQRMKCESGTLGTIKRVDGEFVVEIRGAEDALNRAVGRRFQRRCDAELGDTRCGVDLSGAGLKYSVNVLRLASRLEITVDGLAAVETGFFKDGLCRTSNGGKTVPIRQHYESGGEHFIGFWSAEDNQFQVGDTINLTVGCDKRFATCRKRFSNAENFRGFPHIPGNDFAFAPAKDGVLHDGGPLIVDDD